jgi:hypothetical protein
MMKIIRCAKVVLAFGTLYMRAENSDGGFSFELSCEDFSGSMHAR